MNTSCPLCKGQSSLYYSKRDRLFYRCNQCYAIFLDPNLLPGKEEEKARYDTHNNNVYDDRYREFVSPIVNAIKNNFESDDKGLDFGAGTGPVISTILKESEFQIDLYDPFYHPHNELLKKKYSYVVCCEVIEHFHYPFDEFQLLKNLLLPNGKLFIKTNLYYDGVDFGDWWYKNDFTHVFFYHPKTLDWIKEKLKFSKLMFDEQLIIYSV